MSNEQTVPADKYADYSREELLAEIKRLKKSKKYGLVWEHKKEQVIEDFETQQPYLQEVTEKRIENAPGEPTNLIIEGDNFEALSILNYTHAGKVDVIYIDPPYNTNNKDFIYNDDYVDPDDVFRHSKWLSFMEPRLKLAKNLLRDDGVIFISIDEHEYAALKILMDEIMPDSFIANITWDKRNPKGNSKTISSVTEYILCYGKNLQFTKELRTEKDNAGQMIAKARQLHNKVGKKMLPDCIKESIKLGAKINEKDFSKVYSLDDANDDFWKWLKQQPFLEGEKAYRYIDENGDVFRPVSLAAPKDSKNKYPIMHPLTKKPCACPKTGWRNKEETMNELIAQGNILFGKDEKTIPNRKYKLGDFLTQTLSDLVSYAGNGIDDLRSVSKSDLFDNPKPLFLMKKLLGAVNNRNALVLDFFAGSGTTGQAILELNKKDGGHRRFILCTNNGDKGPDPTRIAEDITYPRVMTVITGKRQDGSKYSDGIPANLRYYKINHVEKKQSVDANRLEIVNYLEDIIQVKENSFGQLDANEDFVLYRNSERFVGMVFEPFALEEIIEQIKDKNPDNLPTKLYVFSYSRDAFDDDFDADFEIEFVAIPEGLLKTYANIVAETKKEDA